MKQQVAEARLAALKEMDAAENKRLQSVQRRTSKEVLQQVLSCLLCNPNAVMLCSIPRRTPASRVIAHASTTLSQACRLQMLGQALIDFMNVPMSVVIERPYLYICKSEFHVLAAQSLQADRVA